MYKKQNCHKSAFGAPNTIESSNNYFAGCNQSQSIRLK